MAAFFFAKKWRVDIVEVEVVKEILIKVLNMGIFGKVFRMIGSFMIVGAIFYFVGIPDERWRNKEYDISKVREFWVIEQGGDTGYREVKYDEVKGYKLEDFWLSAENEQAISDALHRSEKYPESDDVYPKFVVKVDSTSDPYSMRQKVTFTVTDDRRGYQNSYWVSDKGVEPIYHAESNDMDFGGMGIALGFLFGYVVLFVLVFKLSGKLLLRKGGNQ